MIRLPKSRAALLLSFGLLIIVSMIWCRRSTHGFGRTVERQVDTSESVQQVQQQPAQPIIGTRNADAGVTQDDPPLGEGPGVQVETRLRGVPLAGVSVEASLGGRQSDLIDSVSNGQGIATIPIPRGEYVQVRAATADLQSEWSPLIRSPSVWACELRSIGHLELHVSFDDHSDTHANCAKLLIQRFLSMDRGPIVAVSSDPIELSIIANQESTVTAFAEGFEPNSITLSVAAGEWCERTIALRRGRRIQGVVTDAVNGQPISGASVYCISFPDENCVTSEDGTFQFFGVSEETVLVAESPGYQSRSVDARPEEVTRIELRQGRRLVRVLRGNDSVPAQSAVVLAAYRAKWDNNSNSWTVRKSFPCGEDGVCDISTIPGACDVSILASSRDGVSAIESYDEMSRPPDVLRIQEATVARVQVVLEGTESSVSGVLVTARNVVERGRIALEVEAATRLDGAVEFLLPEGTGWSITAERGDMQSLHSVLVLADAPRHDTRLMVARLIHVHGMASDEAGTPLSGAIDLFPLGSLGRTESVPIVDGKFDVDLSEAASFRAEVRWKGRDGRDRTSSISSVDVHRGELTIVAH